MPKVPHYLTQALALARAAKAAKITRLARWGDRLEAAIEQAQDDTDAPTVKNAYPFVRSGD
jgi:hypothetical protein